MKDELGEQIIKEFVGLTEKSYSYLKGNNDEDKKARYMKNCVTKRKLKLDDYKKCLEAARIEKKISHLEKRNKTGVDSLKECHKELLLKAQEIFRSE